MKKKKFIKVNNIFLWLKLKTFKIETNLDSIYNLEINESILYLAPVVKKVIILKLFQS